jgi:hypothetical protein
MRNAIKVMAASAAMMLMTTGAGFAAPVSNAHLNGGAAFGSGVLQVQYGFCERLRWKCEHKYELGQEGEGNCRRYREECGGRDRYCERLRRACEHKYERGEEGQGNCRRYREECGGR